MLEANLYIKLVVFFLFGSATNAKLSKASDAGFGIIVM